MATVDVVLAHAREVGPRCGNVTVIAIDGPAGSGKTTLAGRLALACGAQLLHMDDLYPGWGGLREAGSVVSKILADLAAGNAAAYRRYDWDVQGYRETHVLQPRGTLVIEGVGSVRTEYLDRLSSVALVHEPDPQERLRRGLERDGAEAEPRWRTWMREEAELHREVDLPRRADIRINGRGEVVS